MIGYNEFSYFNFNETLGRGAAIMTFILAQGEANKTPPIIKINKKTILLNKNTLSTKANIELPLTFRFATNWRTLTSWLCRVQPLYTKLGYFNRPCSYVTKFSFPNLQFYFQWQYFLNPKFSYFITKSEIKWHICLKLKYWKILTFKKPCPN